LSCVPIGYTNLSRIDSPRDGHGAFFQLIDRTNQNMRFLCLIFCPTAVAMVETHQRNKHACPAKRRSGANVNASNIRRDDRKEDQTTVKTSARRACGFSKQSLFFPMC